MGRGSGRKGELRFSSFFFPSYPLLFKVLGLFGLSSLLMRGSAV